MQMPVLIRYASAFLNSANFGDRAPTSQVCQAPLHGLQYFNLGNVGDVGNLGNG
jgi:hypothetical protein